MASARCTMTIYNDNLPCRLLTQASPKMSCLCLRRKGLGPYMSDFLPHRGVGFSAGSRTRVGTGRPFGPSGPF